MTYRPDIDGLRAIAVLAVVAYHCADRVVRGGFVGVDIFFVISGYLITKVIAVEIERRHFSIAAFYVRRTKRILPALFVVLATTLALGVFLLTPSELAGLGKTTAATAGFVSNFVFWRDTGYFDIAAERKPLLHTWSLSVEEQFYLLWPLTLLVLSKTSLTRSAVWLALGLSFAASCYGALYRPSAAFFLLPTRAWELLVGAALALRMVPRIDAPVWRSSLACAGLASMAAAILLLDRNSTFPGWNALLPCVGAALIIHTGDGPATVVTRVLSSRPMVFVGLISYSLYLWHWPLLSVARLTQRGELTAGQTFSVVALAFAASVFTWRFIERPFRVKGPTPAATPILAKYVLISAAFLATGLVVQDSGGFLRLASPEIAETERARFDVNPLSGACLRWQTDTSPLAPDACVTGEPQLERRLVIWGDSHADAVAPGIARYAAERGYSTQQLTMAGCPPLVGVTLEGAGARYEPCADFNRQVIRHVADDARVKAVMLTARWTLYTENVRFGRDDPGPVVYLVDKDDRTWSSSTSRIVFSKALDATIEVLRSRGKAVTVLGTIPPLGINIPDCLARNHMPLSGAEACEIDADVVRSHLQYADSEIERIAAKHAGVCTYLPQRALCATGACIGSRDGRILYANDDHVSTEGALFLSRHFDFDSCFAPPARAERAR